jgi:hypothetical protein
MAISPPNFQRDAVPTPSGWRHPRTNELLVSRKITSDQIDEFYGVKPTVAMLKESPTTMEEATAELIVDDTLPSELGSMTKIELEAVGREHGVELDRRKNKADLIQELKEVL